MKTRIHTLSFALFVLCSSFSFRSAALPSKELLGIAPEDANYYKRLSSGPIHCKDGSKTFTKSQLNDDFCDCLDGTDEPGTSACPTGKFYCRNAGHTPITIFSSRVNDGICDCCDGIDEYDGKTECKNTCWEAGKVARDRLQKKIATFKEGVAIRKREVEQAKISAAKDEAELSRLKNEETILQGLVQKLKERKEQIEKAEEKERIQKEKEEKQKREAEDAELKEHKGEEKLDVPEGKPEKSNDEDKLGVQDSPSGQDLKTEPSDTVVEVEHAEIDASLDNGQEEYAEKKEEASEVTQESDLHYGSGSKGDDSSKDSESLSREELGRIIGSRWTGKKSEHHNDDVDNAKDNDKESYDETSDNAHDEEDNGYDTETEEDHPSYEDDDTEDHIEDDEEEANDDSSTKYKYESDNEVDMSDMESTGTPSWLDKIQQTVRNFLQAVNPFQTPVNTSEAATVRKEYDDASGKLSKIQSRISSLTRKLGHDFGQEKEFYSLYGQCFESKQNKYVYKVCPYKEATQEEGHSTTRLGRWEKFEESYRVMLFSNGDKCWNGPDRSLRARLRCGLKVEVADVDEPSRCEYSALLTTPALCLEGKLKELEDKLEALNKDQPQDHDEL